MARQSVHLGIVESFDSAVGLGTVRSSAGTTYRFHSTALTDNTRMTESGVHVAFTLTRGIDGVMEAQSLTPSHATQ